jgi:exosortase family protein XrtF
LLKIEELKSLLLQHKLFFIFLIKFLLFYAVFTFIYKEYLSQYNPLLNEVDSISTLVADNTNALLQLFGHDSKLVAHDFEPSIKIFYKDKYVSRIIEGCNAVSVIILFASFIFAFSSTIKRTVFYIILGTVLIYVLNIVRIALLTYSLYYYPEYEELLHGTIFPLFIYGIVFLLWIGWVLKFSENNKTND